MDRELTDGYLTRMDPKENQNAKRGEEQPGRTAGEERDDTTRILFGEDPGTPDMDRDDDEERPDRPLGERSDDAISSDSNDGM
jgi:hypothetical protein